MKRIAEAPDWNCGSGGRAAGKKSGLRHRGAMVSAASMLAAILLLPPASVFGQQMLQMVSAPDQKAAKANAAFELRSLLESRRRFARHADTLSHPFEFPYLECPEKGAGKVPPSIDETLTMVFIVDARFRDDAAWQKALMEGFSRAQLAMLTACLEASPFAARCETIAYEKTGNFERSDDPRLSDGSRAAAYCAALVAIGAQDPKK